MTPSKKVKRREPASRVWRCHYIIRGEKLMIALSAIHSQIDKIKPELIALLQELIRVPSYPCTVEQNRCLDLISDFLRVPGISQDRWRPDWKKVEAVVSRIDGKPLYTRNDLLLEMRDRISVLVAEYGDGPRTLVLNGHVDVVSPEPVSDWTVDPFSGHIRNGRVYGRGAVDMKGGLVSAVGALRAMAALGIELGGKVQLQAVPEEETGGNGTLACIERGYIGDGAVFLETTSEKVVHHHTGIQDFQIRVTGRPGFILWHRPGVDSIFAMGKVLRALEGLRDEREAEARRRIPDFLENDSPGFINVGFVQAGEWAATCPNSSYAQGLMSLLPGESPEEALGSLERAVSEALSDQEWFRECPPSVTCGSSGQRGATLEPDHPLVTSFVRGARQSGIEDSGPTRGGLMVCDAKITQGGGFAPAIVFGPSGWAAHSTDEYVEIDSVIAVAKATAAGAVNFLGSR